MEPKTRKFAGKIYHWHIGEPTKRAALQQANMLRAKGFQARVTSAPSNPYSIKYAVWWRK